MVALCVVDTFISWDIKSVDLEICPYTMVGTRFYLVLEECQPSANHCVLGQASSTQLVQNVFSSKIGVWAGLGVDLSSANAHLRLGNTLHLPC